MGLRLSRWFAGGDGGHRAAIRELACGKAGQIILGAYSESDKKFHGVYATRTPPRGQVDTDGVLAKAVELSQDQLAEIQAVVAPHMNIAGFVSRLATVGLLPTEVPPEMLKLVSAVGSA